MLRLQSVPAPCSRRLVITPSQWHYNRVCSWQNGSHVPLQTTHMCTYICCVAPCSLLFRSSVTTTNQPFDMLLSVLHTLHQYFRKLTPCKRSGCPYLPCACASSAATADNMKPGYRYEDVLVLDISQTEVAPVALCVRCTQSSTASSRAGSPQSTIAKSW